MSFKPYEPEESYKVVISKDEALLLQRIRAVGYGTITVHMVANRIVRTETTSSELSKDRKEDTVTIAFEVLQKGV